MNEEIAKKVIEYLEGSKDFIIEQAPDLCQQVIAYKQICYLAASFCFGFSIILFSIFLFFFIRRAARKNFEVDEDIFFRTVKWTGLVTLVCAVFCAESCFLYIKVLIAPKMYLIEYFSSIIGG